jgi:hypothetical protein
MFVEGKEDKEEIREERGENSQAKTMVTIHIFLSPIFS